MKTFLILLGLLVSTSLYQPTKAQVSININIGNQPLWGPTGYDYAQYYYLPDLDIYYYVPQQQWIYFDGGRWITTTVLPPRYNSYDLYRLHKVVINDQQPYLHNATYRTKYVSFKGRYDQQPIRDSRDSKYYVINNHPMHGKTANTNPRPNARPAGGPQQANNAQPQARNGQQSRNGQSGPGGRAQARGGQSDNNRSQGNQRGPR